MPWPSLHFENVLHFILNANFIVLDKSGSVMLLQAFPNIV